MITDFGRRLAAAFGMAGGIAIAVVFLVLLPLDLLAVTRMTGWEWGAALGVLLALNLIPIAGQLVYVGLAVVGAFTLGQDNLAERRAKQAAPAQQSAVVRQSAGDPFTEWRKNIAAPAIQKSCLEDVQRRGLVGGAQIDQMARACACYGAAAVSVITPDEMVNDKLEPSEGFNERLGIEARRLCQR